MIKRIKIGIGAAMGVVALAFGGAAIAGATETSGSANDPGTANVQIGNQDPALDTSAVVAEQSVVESQNAEAESKNDSDGSGGPNLEQQGEH